MIRGTTVGGATRTRPEPGHYLYRGQPFLDTLNAEIMKARPPASREARPGAAAETARRQALRARDIPRSCQCPHHFWVRGDKWVPDWGHRKTCATRRRAAS